MKTDVAGYGLRDAYEQPFEPMWGTTLEEDEGDEWRVKVGFSQTVQVGHASANIYPRQKNFLETQKESR